MSWDPVKDAVRYVLWVWTSSGGPERLDNGSLTDTTYTHENLEAGASYHYTARAVNATGLPSGWSPYVTAAIPAEISLASQIFANVSPSIAFIDTETGTGSGVLIEGGWIVTNSHVVWPYTSVRVVFPNGAEYRNLPVRYYDHLADLALLGPVSTPTQYATMLDGEALPIGSPVYLIGYPGEYEGFPQPTMTEGIHSRLRQWDPGPFTFYQSDSTIFRWPERRCPRLLHRRRDRHQRLSRYTGNSRCPPPPPTSCPASASFSPARILTASDPGSSHWRAALSLTT